jgi:hypothetical protein
MSASVLWYVSAGRDVALCCWRALAETPAQSVFAKVFICLHLVSGMLLQEEILLLVLFVYVGTAGAGLLTVPLACPG